LELASSKIDENEIVPIWNSRVPNLSDFPMDDFLHIGFTHHRTILGKVKELDKRIFYVKRCASEHYTVEDLKRSIDIDDFQHQGSFPNNSMRTLPASEQAFRAVNTFKDEYLLDFINVEELGIRDYNKPMGVATYRTSKDMSDELKKVLPNVEDLKKLLDENDIDDVHDSDEE